MQNPLVSVVVLTRDRPELVQRCIQSILNNTYKHIELVVFDNSSEPFRRVTRNFLSALKLPESCKVRYIESHPMGIAEMRQEAINSSQGEIVMSIDDDCVVDEDAILQIVKRFSSDEMIGVVGGSLTNVGFEGKEQFKGRGRIGINGQYEPVRDFKDAEVFGSANMSIRREALNAAGGYDRFFSGALEEADLTLRIRTRGYKVVYEPCVKITHFHSPLRFRSKWRNIGVHRLYFFFKHFMPKNPDLWLEFLKNEICLVVHDIHSLITHFRFLKRLWKSGNNTEKFSNNEFLLKHKLYYQFLVDVCYRFPRYFCIPMLKLIVARIAIPYLIYRAHEYRKIERATK